jgi:endonuclease/exonuclease/phosphatase family metal-dependent hydrolase
MVRLVEDLLDVSRITTGKLRVQLERLPLAEVIEHRLPGAIPGRGALSVRLGAGPETLLVVIVHLALGKPTRAKQIGHLGELLRDEPHAILLGDMNFKSESSEMRRLVSLTGLRQPAHGLFTHPSWRPVRNIDHILVSPSLSIGSVEVPDHPVSDHLPVAASVSLPRRLRLGSAGRAPAGSG